MIPKEPNSRKFIVQRSIDLESFYDVAEIEHSHNEDFNTFTDKSFRGDSLIFIE